MIDFITLDEYKGLNGMLGTQQDAQLQSIIEGVNVLIEQYTNRSYYYNSSETTLKFTITPDKTLDRLFLPVLEVKSITRLTDNINALTLVEFTDYYYDATDSTLVPLKAWPIGRESLSFVGFIGFTSIPEDLKLAASELVTNYFKREGARRTSAQTTPLTYEPIQGNMMPNHVRIILDQYRLRS